MCVIKTMVIIGYIVMKHMISSQLPEKRASKINGHLFDTNYIFLMQSILSMPIALFVVLCRKGQLETIFTS